MGIGRTDLIPRVYLIPRMLGSLSTFDFDGLIGRHGMGLAFLFHNAVVFRAEKPGLVFIGEPAAGRGLIVSYEKDLEHSLSWFHGGTSAINNP